MPWVIEEQDLKRAARKAEGRGRRKKVKPDQKTKKRQKLENKQRHENEKDRGQNQDQRKESEEIRATVRQKPERGKTISARIKGREVRIPPDQQRRLDRGDSWLPVDPHQTANFTAARDPEQGSKMVDVMTKRDQPKQRIGTAGAYDALGL